jgi:hypothetical protein
LTTLLTELLHVLASEFDDHTYPGDVYEALLERIRLAQNSQELGNSLAHALAWKDGKTRRATGGSALINYADVGYVVGATRPNTLSEHHLTIMRSDEFFVWASGVRDAKCFDLGYLDDLQIRFNLWNSLVIPVFVLHALQPRLFPIVDQHVLRAHALLTSGSVEFVASLRLYVTYQKWWLRLVTETGLDAASANLRDLKELDCGLWVLGKQLKKGLSVSGGPRGGGGGRSAPVSLGPVALAAGLVAPTLSIGTHSPEFKQRAVDLARTMTQREAVQQAAREFDIVLKSSYLAYPGSHFDRWRNQGFR